jgi:hypothetical protein
MASPPHKFHPNPPTGSKVIRRWDTRQAGDLASLLFICGK